MTHQFGSIAQALGQSGIGPEFMIETGKMVFLAGLQAVVVSSNHKSAANLTNAITHHISEETAQALNGNPEIQRDLHALYEQSADSKEYTERVTLDHVLLEAPRDYASALVLRSSGKINTYVTATALSGTLFVNSSNIPIFDSAASYITGLVNNPAIIEFTNHSLSSSRIYKPLLKFIYK